MFIHYAALFFIIQLYLLFSFLRHVCFGYAYQNYNFEPKYASTRYVYKKCAHLILSLLIIGKTSFSKAKENESFFGRFYIIVITNPLV